MREVGGGYDAVAAGGGRSAEVLVCGAGLTPFDRSEATGMQLAVEAVNAALADAGLPWPRVRAAFGGSDAAGNADTLVTRLGLTGLPFVNVRNGCATGGSALVSAVNAATPPPVPRSPRSRWPRSRSRTAWSTGRCRPMARRVSATTPCWPGCT